MGQMNIAQGLWIKDLVEDFFLDSPVVSIQRDGVRCVFEDEETGEEQILKILVRDTETDQDKMGVHVFIEDSSDDWRITSAIEDALRDAFPCIYVHLSQ